MNISLIDKNKCTGCLLCIAACPSKCILKESDTEGFYIPNIDETKCINCGICYKNCPVVCKVEKSVPIACYAIQGKEIDTLTKSASGGMAYILGQKVIENEGSIFGCVFDKNFIARHKKAVNTKELQWQCGSKYVQSDFSETYADVKMECEEGKQVVIVGTPCQIAGIKRYLSKDYQNLLLVDLICHGVPSPTLFSRYITWLEKKMGDRIVAYYFRDKTKGWSTTCKIVGEKQVSVCAATEDAYYSAFLYGETYKECCYNCDYATKERISDITIGDYWGVSKQCPEWKVYKEKGVSAVLVNTEKGRKWFEEIKGRLDYVSTTFEQIASDNENLMHPAARPKLRDTFYQSIETHGFMWADKKMKMSIRYYVSWIKNRVPKRITKYIKKY